MIFSRIRNWLHAPVIEDHSADMPFRVRLGSVVLIVFGWVIFAAACLTGWWALRSGMPVYSTFDFARGVVIEGGEIVARLAPDRISTFVFYKYVVRSGEVVGATLFVLGLLSIVLFNRRDRVRTWRPRAL